MLADTRAFIQWFFKITNKNYLLKRKAYDSFKSLFVLFSRIYFCCQIKRRGAENAEVFIMDPSLYSLHDGFHLLGLVYENLLLIPNVIL